MEATHWPVCAVGTTSEETTFICQEHFWSDSWSGSYGTTDIIIVENWLQQCKPVHTTATVLRPFNFLSEPVPKEHSPTYTYPDHQPSFISFLHLLRSIPVQFTCLTVFCTTSVHVLFGLPFGLESSTLYSIHFFIQFHPIQTLVSTAASASPSTLSMSPK